MKQIAILALGLSLAGYAVAHVPGAVADVSIVDRDSGATLEPHFYRGEYWVAGTPGARYAVRIRNRLGERVLAVTAVDGVNVISGETAGWDQTGYVLAPGESYDITGWRKSDFAVAAFSFTASPNSYAARTGRPANTGVIGVALFRERAAPPPPVLAPPVAGLREPTPPARAEDAAGRARAANSAEAAGSPVAPSASLGYAVPAPAAKLGTAHGEREASYTYHTEFMRERDRPNEVIRIRYDSLENLIAMGIVTRPRPTPPVPNPFPGSSPYAYVPDPPG